MSSAAASTRPPRARPWDADSALTVAALGIAAVALGTLVAVQPKLAVAIVAAGAIVVLAFRAPVAHLLLLIASTAIVPLAVQSMAGSGGSADSAGLLPSDVLMLTGLARAAWVLRRRPPDRRGRVVVGLTLAFLAVDVIQLVHALSAGRAISGAGAEFRALLGFGTVLIALPLLADARSRDRLLRGAVGIGLALGLWGIVQHLMGIVFDPPTDLGASSIPSFATSGRVIGQYAFPVAALIVAAVLSSGRVRPGGRVAALLAVLALNLVAIVVTFERTFVLETAGGLVIVAMLATRRQRRRLLIWTPVALVSLFLALTVTMPTLTSAFEQRVSSIAAYQTDPSVTYRVVEGRMVGDEIARHPLTGSGLGATILIGRPGTRQVVAPRQYAENGYLWMAWKLGWPAAAVLWTLVLVAILWPAPRGEEGWWRAMRTGCRASLAVLALGSFTFPSFNELPITPTMGVLLAVCAAPLAIAGGRR